MIQVRLSPHHKYGCYRPSMRLPGSRVSPDPRVLGIFQCAAGQGRLYGTAGPASYRL